MNALLTKKNAATIGAHLKRVRDEGLADAIGGFNEWIALCGYSRQQAERLIALSNV
jgi:hypothetical protein